ncbi:MAG: hypothetical protein KHZ24_04365 [Coriobacteriia bacterium]|nr:hypothetical protein [Coriobacteriia bacterium]
MDSYEVEFRNPVNGDMREWAFSPVGSRVAFLLAGPLYLLWKGAVRAAVRLVLMLLCAAAACWVAAGVLRTALVYPLWVLSSLLFYTSSGGAVELGPLTYAVLIAVHVWFTAKLPGILARDLFVSGYAPSSDVGWRVLGSLGIFEGRQLDSYYEAYAHGAGGDVSGGGGDREDCCGGKGGADLLKRLLSEMAARGLGEGVDYSLDDAPGEVWVNIYDARGVGLDSILNGCGFDGGQVLGEILAPGQGEGGHSAPLDGLTVRWEVGESGVRGVCLVVEVVRGSSRR